MKKELYAKIVYEIVFLLDFQHIFFFLLDKPYLKGYIKSIK